jgi:hypothetical protein
MSEDLGRSSRRWKWESLKESIPSVVISFEFGNPSSLTFRPAVAAHTLGGVQQKQCLQD